jgi:RNA processing factor Prp31
MPFVFNDPQHWLDRAAEAREIAGKMTDLAARADMLSIADEYQKIAERAASRLKTLSPDEAKPAKPPST